MAAEVDKVVAEMHRVAAEAEAGSAALDKSAGETEPQLR